MTHVRRIRASSPRETSRGAAQARVTGADLQGTVVDQSGTALVLRQRNRLVQDIISCRVITVLASWVSSSAGS